MTITEFLLARIAEDEAVNPDDIDSNWCSTYGGKHYSQVRVLAECAAKRAIIELHEYEWMGPDDAAGKGCRHDYEPWPCPTIRLLAAVYADHLDYRQEWAA